MKECNAGNVEVIAVVFSG